MRTKVKGPPRAMLGFVALDLCESDTVSPSPLAGSACRVHGCADADTAHKMRHGCDLQVFAVRPLNLFKSSTNEDARINRPDGKRTTRMMRSNVASFK